MVTVVVRYGGTINIGNFENVKLEFEIQRTDVPSNKNFVLQELRQIRDSMETLFEESKSEILTKSKR